MPLSMEKKLRVLAVAATASLACAAEASPIFNNLVVFGDSLSDNGNYYALTGGASPPSPPYFQGRWSNGPVWVEHLAGSLGVPLIDRAVAGATTRDVYDDQIVPFTTPGSIPPDALYVVWAGVNDFLSLPPNPFAAVDAAIANLDRSVRRLASAGATEILVPNLVDLGRTPGAIELGNPFLIGLARTIADEFNGELAHSASRWRGELGVNVIELDVFGLLEQAIANPSAFGLTNVTQRALRANGTVVPNPADYLFWDEIHPTAAVHALYADRAYASVPEPTTLLTFTTLMLLSSACAIPFPRRRVQPPGHCHVE